MRNIKELLNLDLEAIINNVIPIKHLVYNNIEDCIYLQLESKFLKMFDKLLVHFSNGIITDLIFMTEDIENNAIEDVFQLILNEYGTDFLQETKEWKKDVEYGWCFKNLKHEKTDNYHPYLYGVFISTPNEFSEEKVMALNINRYDSLEHISIETIR